MKKTIYNILGLSLILLFTACEAEEFVRPIMDLELMSNEVYLNLISTELASATFMLEAKTGGYSVESSDENITTASNEGTGAVITIIGK